MSCHIYTWATHWLYIGLKAMGCRLTYRSILSRSLMLLRKSSWPFRYDKILTDSQNLRTYPPWYYRRQSRTIQCYDHYNWILSDCCACALATIIRQHSNHNILRSVRFLLWSICIDGSVTHRPNLADPRDGHPDWHVLLVRGYWWSDWKPNWWGFDWEWQWRIPSSTNILWCYDGGRHFGVRGG